MVIQDAVIIRRILPHKFRLSLNISSFIYPVENKSFNQLSVSKHSFLAIFNLESISGKLCGYWQKRLTKICEFEKLCSNNLLF